VIIMHRTKESVFGLTLAALAFMSMGAVSSCSGRTKVSPTPPHPTGSGQTVSKHITEDGPYEINVDILPGVWTALAPSTEANGIKCNWKLQQTPSTESGVKDGTGEPGKVVTVEVTTDYLYFTVDHCGDWTWIRP
jgi:hypothetical protein